MHLLYNTRLLLQVSMAFDAAAVDPGGAELSARHWNNSSALCSQPCRTNGKYGGKDSAISRELMGPAYYYYGFIFLDFLYKTSKFSTL